MSSASAQSGLTLKGEAVTENVDGEVTILFRTEGFWQITQGMGTIQWDSHVADYVSAGDFGIPEITGDTFNRIPEGMLTFDWSSDNILGNTIPDGTTLFSLTFGVRGADGNTTSVAFTNGWTPLHFESVESVNLPFSSVPGDITVVPEPAPGIAVALGMLALAAMHFKRRTSAI